MTRPAPGPDLRVDFCGDVRSIEAGARLSFGRAADIVIDENRFLHRVLGEFDHRSGLWWIANVGTSISLAVHDRLSTSFTRVAPGSAVPLAFDLASIRFDAGGRAYEIDVEVVRRDATDDTDGRRDAPSGVDDPAEMTTTTSSLPLTDEQRELLEALAAPLLAGDDSLPTNREIANALGWTITKFNRKLDGLCTKYAKAGVTGLRGSSDQLAKDRRMRLAEHVIDAGIVTAD